MVDIGVVGLGFVGLTSALGFAEKGFTVRGYDIDEPRRKEISSGEIPFFEPGLEDALNRTLGEKFFIADDFGEILTDSDVVFICVGTPTSNDGSADLRFLLSALDDLHKFGTANGRRLVVIKSTIPPGTMAKVITPHLQSLDAEYEKVFSMALNPEFLREGHSYDDFVCPDRIICGVNDDWARETLSQIYAPFDAPIHFVSPSTAEFIKYLSNSLLATLISFSNEMAQIAEHIGDIDVASAFLALHEDKRLRGAGINHYIYPGCGYGGYCLPKDTVAMSVSAERSGFTARILDGVISLNNEMPTLTAQKIGRLAQRYDAKIGILGLSFKPGSDDVRDTPAAKIISELKKFGYTNIYAYDPIAMKAFRDMYELDISYCETKEVLCKECDVVAVVTVWPEFLGIRKEYPELIVCDCRYLMEEG